VLVIFTAGTHRSYSRGAATMVIALWVDPAEDDRVFATVGYWLGTSQARFAVVGDVCDGG